MKLTFCINLPTYDLHPLQELTSDHEYGTLKTWKISPETGIGRQNW